MSTTTGIPLAQAEILGIVLESVLYGIFLVVFSLGAYTHRKSLSQPGVQPTTLDRIVFLGSIFTFLAVSAHWILDFSILFDSVFGKVSGHTVDLYFSEISQKTLAKGALFEVQIWIGDLILMYRLWRVYQKNYMIILVPLAAWIGQVVAGSVMLYGLSKPGAALQSRIRQWVTACFSFILVNNIYCTVLIAWRLWTTGKAVSRSGNTNFLRVIKVFVESAALFALFISIAFVTFLAGSNIQFLFSDMTVPAVGIAFCMIVAGLNYDVHQNNPLSSFPLDQEHNHTTSHTSFTYPPGSKSDCESFKLQHGVSPSDTSFSPLRPGVPAIMVGAAM